MPDVSVLKTCIKQSVTYQSEIVSDNMDITINKWACYPGFDMDYQ